MRRVSFMAVLAVLCVMLFPGLSLADKVEVYTVREENMSPMELRTRALAEGFAKAVAGETQAMLGGALDANRLEAVRRYFVGHATDYIQGYNILSSEDVEDGLFATLDVRVNRGTLRDGLTRLGFFETVKAPQPASVSWPADLTDDELAELQSLAVMSGLAREEGVYPAFTLERGPEGTYKGTLATDTEEWTSAGQDMAVVWASLWTRFFSLPKDDGEGPKRQQLVISGWFTPDGALEFDGVLRGWDFAVQNARLVEMDIQPTGVGATWDMSILDGKRLATLLNSYLPQRGLSFQLNRPAE